MSIGLSRRPVGDVVVIEVNGNIDTSTRVETALGLARSQKVLFCFRGVKKVELAAIMAMEAWAKKPGNQLRVVNATRIKDANTLIRIALACPVHEDEAEALRSFS